MLKIIVSGKAVDYAADINLTINAENQLMTEDRIPMAYTFPIELPLTVNNRRLFGFPDRLTIVSRVQELPCEICFDGYIVDVGVFVVDSIEDKIVGHFRGIEFNEKFSKPLNELTVSPSDLLSLTSTELRDANDSDKSMVVFPVRVLGSNILINNYAGERAFRPGYMNEYFLAYRVNRLFRAIFGESLVENHIPNDLIIFPLDTITLRNLSALEYKRYYEKEYLPLTNSKKFVTNICRLLCLSVVISKGKYVVVGSWDFFNAEILDWDDKVLNITSLAVEPKKTYKYGYSGDDPSAGKGNRVKVKTPYDLFLKESDGLSDQQYEITDIDQIVNRLPGDIPGRPWNYEIVSTGFNDEISEDNDSYDTQVDFKPLDMTFNTLPRVFGGNEWFSYWMPQIKEGDVTKGAEPRLGVWLGMQQVLFGSAQYPCVSSYGFDGSVNFGPEFPVARGTSLKWDGGTYGLIASYHILFKRWIEKDKLVIKCRALLTMADIADLSFVKKYHIKGKIFFLKSYSITFTADNVQPIDCEFVEV